MTEMNIDIYKHPSKAQNVSTSYYITPTANPPTAFSLQKHTPHHPHLHLHLHLPQTPQKHQPLHKTIHQISPTHSLPHHTKPPLPSPFHKNAKISLTRLASTPPPPPPQVQSNPHQWNLAKDDQHLKPPPRSLHTMIASDFCTNNDDKHPPLPVCLSVCLSACLPVCLSACLSVCLSVCPPVCSMFNVHDKVR